MTSRPRLYDDINAVQGLAAVALFAVLALVFVTASGFGAPQGFPEGSITAAIGYAMFDMTDQAAVDSEPFLVSFIVIAVVLDAALDGAIMLAKREEGGDMYGSGGSRAVRTDGGREGDD